MQQCESSSQPKRKRLRNIIKHDGAAKRRDNSQREYYKIFQRVLEVYLDAKQAQPYGSSLILLDASLRSTFRRWTQDSAHTVIDFENAVTKALAKSPELQEKFALWFLRDERPEFKAADIVQYNRIVKKCAGEFLRRGMHPIWKWFRTPQRPGRSALYAAITKS
jgi:hypothetical protein